MEGRFYSKAQFDLAARERGTIEQADELQPWSSGDPAAKLGAVVSLWFASAASRGRLATAVRRRASRPSGSS